MTARAGTGPSGSAAAAALPYRPCVGIMLLDRAGRVLVGQRIDMPSRAWQMPQGGIDPGEEPGDAARRELREEIGTDRAEVIAQTAGWLRYDLPPDLASRLWGGRFRGQEQKWFLFRFTGSDTDIVLDAHEREFAAVRWVAPDSLLDLVVPFKRDIYRAVLAEFASYLKRPGA